MLHLIYLSVFIPVIQVEDLPEPQRKNVVFEISPLATTGVFHVQVKFMGVAVETVEVDIQVRLKYLA